MGVIDRGMTIHDFDVSPSFKRREHHEHRRRPVAFIFVIATRRLPWFHRDRETCFLDELLDRFVEADERVPWVSRSFVNVEDSFHRSDKGAVGVRRNNPLFFAVGFENVFFRTRPIVLSLASISSSTIFSSSNRKVHRARPAGGFEQASAISLASFSPSKIRGRARTARFFRSHTASKPSSTSCCRVL